MPLFVLWFRDFFMAGSPASKPAGLSVFFPAYNDSGTIASMVIRAVKAASELTPDFEVIVVDDGSADSTADIADELARTYPQVRAVHHPINRDYGAALQTGFRSSTKELIFYTDGDAQYDPSELAVLWARMSADCDLVNGYKISRADPLHRIVIGRVYHHIVSILFGLKLRDVDCDFRLMRRTIFERINLEKTSGIICVEMMKKIQDARVPDRRSAGASLSPRVRHDRSSSTSDGFSERAAISCCCGPRSSFGASTCVPA